MKSIAYILLSLTISLTVLGCSSTSSTEASSDCTLLIKQCELRTRLRLPLAARSLFKRLEAGFADDSGFSGQKQSLTEAMGKLEDSLKTAAAKNLELIGPGKEWSPKLAEGFMRNWPHDASDPVIVFREGKYGFARRDGAMVTEFAFEAADPFWEGFARVSKGGKEYLIDQNGKSFETAFYEDEIKPGVEAIDLSVSELKNLPEAVFSVSDITVLRLGANHIQHLSADIGKLKNLQHLQVSVNSLMKLPGELTTLKSIRSLRASSNTLNEIPASIGEMTGLKELYLDDNQLFKLPDGLWDLVGLEALFLDWNDLGSIDLSKISQLKHLKVLDQGGDKLSKVNDALWELTELTALDLSNNDLDEIPNGLAKLKQLKALDLGGNDMLELPVVIKDMKQLRLLFLSTSDFESSKERQKAAAKQVRDWLPECEVVFD